MCDEQADERKRALTKASAAIDLLRSRDPDDHKKVDVVATAAVLAHPDQWPASFGDYLRHLKLLHELAVRARDEEGGRLFEAAEARLAEYLKRFPGRVP